jgi:flagellar hook-length control protein FliK
MAMATPVAAPIAASAAEPAARQSSNIQPAPSVASQQATRGEVPAEPQFRTTPVAASSTQASAASAGVQQATAQPIVDTAAAADGAQENEATPVVRIPTRFERQPATEVVKPAPVAVQAEPASDVAAQHTSEVAVHLRSEATSHQQGAGELYRPSGLESQRVGADGFAPTVETGTDGQSSSEQDARRTLAGQRLAAALSMQAPAAAAETAAGAAPTFTVPAASAPAAVAPVAAAVPVTPAAPAQTPDAENVAKLVEAMRVTTRAGGWEAVVRLKPEHFGEVTIQLKVDGNSVSATVNAESAGVRQWLAAQEESVRSGMAEHGLQLDRFAVSRDGQRREAEEQQHEQHRQPRRRTPQRAAGEPEPRFEVVV